ncbi:arginine--tRNA ligase [Salinarchaeum sp. IM2453]|uniref:arginine--tRNA ligase n=1 Tax=Salinarchaeum sp. IM2453 TaxID=2862870 RepID=UPI001C840537|nr:arginine--tRNA ligase [Salinarchaeum sp. IM2453]QZA89414.1 arginine--tRNA ligase [Salinarchaeum sp. IM2453]
MFLAAKQEIKDALESALSDLSYTTEDLGIERPPEDVDAIIASSVAYRLAGKAQAPPPKVAEEIAGEINTAELQYIDEVTATGAYVNFEPSSEYHIRTLEAGQNEKYGRRPDKQKSVVVEHTSANPTGPVHVGRARNPIIGDAIARLLDYAGFDVETHYYVNDAGRQIATFTWAYETFDETELPEPERDKQDYDLVRYYRKGNTFLEEGPEEEVEVAEEEIAAIMQGLEEGKPETYDRVSEVVDTVLSGMQDTLNRLPAEFDEFIKETKFIRDGSTKEIVTQLKKTEYAQETEDGAWELKLDDFGFEKNLVFVRSDGTSLYTTRDIAHHSWKFDNFDRAVTVLGEDHKLQAKQLSTALELLGEDTDALDSIHYSWVNLPDGTMSTREGKGIDLDDLLDEAVARAKEEVEKRLGDRVREETLTEEKIEQIAHQVGIGAVRYDIVAKQPTKQITFKWEQALDFEAQSAPYVQYAHARCSGIIEEAAAAGIARPSPEKITTTELETDAEVDLVETVARFPAVVEDAADELQPHVVATYTRTIADKFNGFYRECPVLDAEGKTQQQRLAIVVATKHAIQNALDILGIDAPNIM